MFKLSNPLIQKLKIIIYIPSKANEILYGVIVLWSLKKPSLVQLVSPSNNKINNPLSNDNVQLRIAVLSAWKKYYMGLEMFRILYGFRNV